MNPDKHLDSDSTNQKPEVRESVDDFLEKVLEEKKQLEEERDKKPEKD